MTRRIICALAIMVGIMCFGTPNNWAQQSPKKAAADKASAEKGATEKADAEKGLLGSNSTANEVSESAMKPIIRLQTPADTRITINMSDDSRAVYLEIGKQAGIEVLFDHDYASRKIDVNVKNATLQDALKTAALASGTFWFPATSKSIMVAADAPAKRRELEPQFIRIFYLPHITAPTEMQDVVNTLRTIVELQRITMVPADSSINMRGTADQISVAEKLIEEKDEAKKRAGEYRIEFHVNELADGKQLSSQTYALLATAHQLQPGKLHIGTKVLRPTGKDNSLQFVDLGKDIVVQLASEDQGRLGMRITLDITEEAPTGQPASTQAADASHDAPDIQHVKMETSTTLELGKPTIVSVLEAPVSKHRLEIEVTATRSKKTVDQADSQGPK